MGNEPILNFPNLIAVYLKRLFKKKCRNLLKRCPKARCLSATCRVLNDKMIKKIILKESVSRYGFYTNVSYSRSKALLQLIILFKSPAQIGTTFLDIMKLERKWCCQFYNFTSVPKEVQIQCDVLTLHDFLKQAENLALRRGPWCRFAEAGVRVCI